MTGEVSSGQVGHERRHGAKTQPGRKLGYALIALLIVAPAAYPALTIWSSNDILPKAYRLILVAAVFVLIGVAVFWLVNRRISDSRISAFITFFVILILASFGQILARWSWGWRWLVAGVALTVSIVIVLRLRNRWLLDVILIAGAAALFFPPLLTGVWNSLTGEEAAPLPPSAAEVPEMVARPDIFLVIVDGYTSLTVLRALFGFEDPDLEGGPRRQSVPDHRAHVLRVQHHPVLIARASTDGFSTRGAPGLHNE